MALSLKDFIKDEKAPKCRICRLPELEELEHGLKKLGASVPQLHRWLLQHCGYTDDSETGVTLAQLQHHFRGFSEGLRHKR